jgi:cytochrome c
VHTVAKVLVVTLLATFALDEARANETLLQSKNCYACHGIDKRKYGPNFKEVAEKYAKDPKAVDKLAQKIRKGGTGVWGKDIMPPQPQVSQADARTLSQFILSLDPAAK